MASHWPFGHLSPKLWAKERSGVKLAVWLPTTKSRESTSSRHPNWECDTSLERSRRGLQVCFRPHCDQTLSVGSYELPKSWDSTRDNFGTISRLQLGSPGKKSHWDVVPETWRREYYMGEGGDFPRVRAVWCVLWSKVPMACPNTQGCLGMWTNHVGGLFWCKFMLDVLNLLPSLIPGLPTRPSTPF